jgi:PPOX class probable F420-dependent enzyme
METNATTRLPDKAKDILSKQTFAHLATLMPDGSPQVTPVWADYEGDRIVVNTAEGRTKPRNMRDDPRVALSATDPDNPYEAVIVRGHVDEITHDGADEHIDAMAKKYLGMDRYPFRQMGEQRVKVYIEPEVVKGANE